MRAVLVATGLRQELSTLLQLRPSPLINIGDRPVIFHIVEYLVTIGVKHIDLILNYFPEMIENTLGNGTRWGIEINFHLAKDPEYPFAVLAPISRSWKEDYIIFGQGDTMPFLHLYKMPDSTIKEPIFYQYQDNTWTEWGIFPTSILGSISAKETVKHLPELFKKRKLEITKPYISARNFLEMIRSNQTFMRQGNFPHQFPTTSRNIEPEVWISRAVTIHPTVKITPPIFIGENCQINRGVKLGPFAVIENHCIIDEFSTVEDSIVCQKSYVGETLNVKSCIVDRNTLINLKFGTLFEVKEDFILSEVEVPNFKNYLMKFLERELAAICFLLLLPIIIPLWIKYGMKTEEMLIIPSREREGDWKTFPLFSFNNPKKKTFVKLPHLINIICGHIHFVGLTPRTINQIKELTSDWKKFYLKSKAGIITIFSVNDIPADSSDEIYASEVYYSSQMCLKNDLKLFASWFYKKITTPL
jgi:mannose-1-phosphate guanylyltransferase/phosphomannomutase